MPITMATIACATIVFFNDEATGASVQYQLYEHLFGEYSTFIRPVDRHQDILTVEFELSIYNIIDLNEKNQVMTVNAEMIMRWNDSFLTWDPMEFDGQDTIRVPWKEIWSPDVVLYNSADSAYEFAVYNTLAVVKSSGSVLLLSHAILRSSCEINIIYYPFDQQVCVMIFSSWTQDKTQIQLRSGPAEGDISAYVENPEFFLENFYVELVDTSDPCCEQPFSTLKYHVQLQRRTAFTLFFFIMPGIFVNLSALMVFSLPCESGEKISLGISALLAMMVFLMTMTENLPPTQSIPLAGTYYGICIGVLTANICASVYVLNIHYKGLWGYPVPNWVRIFLFDVLGRMLLVHIPPRIRRSQVAPRMSIAVASLGNVFNPASDDQQARPTTAMSVRDKSALIASSQRDLDEIANRILGHPGSGLLQVNDPGSGLRQVNDPGQLDVRGKVVSNIQETLENIEKHMSARRQQDEISEFKEALAEEWKLVAYVVDRLCAVVFAIITLVFNIVILTASPEVTKFEYCRGPPGSCN